LLNGLNNLGRSYLGLSLTVTYVLVHGLFTIDPLSLLLNLPFVPVLIGFALYAWNWIAFFCRRCLFFP
jgi:hypothetical protein